MAKNAQMEMMGLIMIVIILSFMLVFGIGFVKSGDDKPSEQTFGERTLGTGFVSVLADTYIDYCGTDYATIAKSCARGQTLSCGEACLVAIDVATQLITNTQDLWGENYRFRIMNSTDTLVELPSIATCGDNDSKEAPGIELIPLFPTPGEVQIMLEICKN